MYDKIYKDIKLKWDKIAKPIDGLGKFEDIICKIGAIEKSVDVKADKKITLIFCSDNGIVEEGVAQTDNLVTALVCNNISKGISTSAKLAKVAGSDIAAVDVGVKIEVKSAINKNISRGTNNFLKKPAMTIDEAKLALKYGMDIIGEFKEKGYNICAIGEMGIGNTTTASAIASCLLKLPVEIVTGRGSGLNNKAFERKKEVIKKAIDLYKPKDIWEIISTLGGYDIISMAGAILGGKKYNMPIIIDGAVSQVSALIAYNLDNEITKYIIPSHIGKEPASKIIMEKLSLDPVIYGNMALGEGSGAIMLFPLIDMALSIYEGKTFSDINMEDYKRW
ncbi:MAG: nicotinate-nucleotide--dimethylbenzimidazole phosphoribosyltransferase [Lachnospirales bacterium]